MQILFVDLSVPVEKLGPLRWGWISSTECGTAMRDTEGSIARRSTATRGTGFQLSGEPPKQPTVKKLDTSNLTPIA
jgi:hypothetical protein